MYVCRFACRSMKTKSLYEPAILILISFGCLRKRKQVNMPILLYILMAIKRGSRMSSFFMVKRQGKISILGGLKVLDLDDLLKAGWSKLLSFWPQRKTGSNLSSGGLKPLVFQFGCWTVELVWFHHGTGIPRIPR